jgi:hypothetical protein
MKDVTDDPVVIRVLEAKLEAFGRKIGEGLTDIKNGVLNAQQGVNDQIRKLFYKEWYEEPH